MCTAVARPLKTAVMRKRCEWKKNSLFQLSSSQRHRIICVDVLFTVAVYSSRSCNLSRQRLHGTKHTAVANIRPFSLHNSLSLSFFTNEIFTCSAGKSAICFVLNIEIETNEILDVKHKNHHRAYLMDGWLLPTLVLSYKVMNWSRIHFVNALQKPVYLIDTHAVSMNHLNDFSLFFRI